MSILGAAFLLAIVVACFFLSIILMVAQRVRPVNTWLALVAVSCGVWTLGITLFLVHPQPDIAGWYVRMYYFAAAIIPFALYFFLHYFPHMVPISKSEAAVMTGALVLLLTAVSWPGALMDIVEQSGRAVVLLNEAGYAVYVGSFLFLSISCLFLALANTRGARKKGEVVLARQASKTVTIAIIALSGGILFNLLLPMFGNYNLIWAGPPFAAFFTIYVFYVITQQGLFDIRAALARTSAYTLMLCVALALYAMVLFAASEMLFPHSDVSRWQLLFYVTMALILLVSARPLRAALDRFTHNIFYRSDYDAGKTMEEITKITSSEIELRRLVRRSVDALCYSIQPEYGSLFVFSSSGKTYHYGKNLSGKRMYRLYRKQLSIVEDRLYEIPYLTRSNDVISVDERRMLDEAKASVVVQLTLRDEHLGVLFLGERKSGERYNNDDLRMLRTACDELALAVQNALRFEEIQKFNQRLREEIARATKDLRRSNRELHHLDEVKNDFLSIASHQLRTPLTSIKGYLSMVLDGDAGEVTPAQRQLLEESFVSSQRMVALIEDFLNLSRLQTGRFSIEPAPVDLAKIVREEVDSLRSTATTRSLKLQSVISKEFPELLLIDEGKIRQVIMNLIDNAIYYSRPDNVIQVRLSRMGGRIRFTVHDKGIGVPKREQSRLFTRFYRAQNARKQRPDGTGVGLYLAKRVVDEHGGDMIFRSVEGEGSTFGFTLPLDAQLLESEESQSE